MKGRQLKGKLLQVLEVIWGVSLLVRCGSGTRRSFEEREPLDDIGFAVHNKLGCNTFRGYLSSRLPRHRVLGFCPGMRARGWGTDTSRRTGPQLVLFLVPHLRVLGPASLEVSGLGLKLCGLQEWCWLGSTVLDPVEVERQLDLSSVAARLRVTCEAHPFFFQVKESRRISVPLLVPVNTAVESGLRHQQRFFSSLRAAATTGGGVPSMELDAEALQAIGLSRSERDMFPVAFCSEDLRQPTLLSSPFLPFLLLFLLSEEGKLPSPLSGGLGLVASASSWRSCGAASWSEEEVAELREGPFIRQKVTGNLSHSGSDRLVVAFPSAFCFQFPIMAEDGSCPSWALPSDNERDGSIRRVLNLKATPDVSLPGCDRIHVTFYLRVATGFLWPSGFGVCWLQDPHPREPIEGVLRATNVLELAAVLVDSRAEGKTVLVHSHCLSRYWFWSHVVVSGVVSQLGRAVVVRAPDCWFCNPFLGAVLDGTGIVSCGDTWLFLPDLVEVWDVGACVVRLWSHVGSSVFRELFVSAGACRGLLPHCGLLRWFCGSRVWPDPGCGSWRYSFLLLWLVASFPAGSECELQESVVVVAGCACYEHGCWFARATIGFVIGVRILGVFARAKQMLVCRVAPWVERCDTCLWLLLALCWLVVNSGEVLLEFFSIGSCGGLRCAIRLAGCSGGFSQSGALVVLVEVLPGPACVASAVLLAAVFSMMVPVVRPFGLCVLVKAPPRIALLSFLAEVLPKRRPLALLVEVLHRAALCGAVDRVSGCGVGQVVFLFVFEFLGYADGGLVNAVGVWLAVPLGLSGRWCTTMALNAVLCTMATFVAKALFQCVFCLCLNCALEALVAVWCVALSAYGGSPISGTPGFGHGLCPGFPSRLEASQSGYPTLVWVPLRSTSKDLRQPTLLSSPFLPFLLLSLLSEEGKLPSPLSGGLGLVASASLWRSCGATSWSEEEVAELLFDRGGGWLVSKLVRGRSHQLGTRPVLLLRALTSWPFGVWALGWVYPRALPSDGERDSSIRRVLTLKATPGVSLPDCDRIHVVFCLRVTIGFSLPSGFGVCWLRVRRWHPGHRDWVATGWSSPSCSEGNAPVVIFWLSGFWRWFVPWLANGPPGGLREPVEGVLWATSVLELAAVLTDSRAEGKTVVGNDIESLVELP
ncbi:hypothetical protein Taro_028575 [Colocasia esculenta]|uniref:Uncharacterized protein n=1 Tax=Colocasia esculenta TaxID=4460 RepID=A0A843VBL8_COLES|nr:hypothetical protein [Colocasia esculenta]